MENFSLSYREVIPEAVQNWKEITLNTGGTQSTLQDIKVAEKAGGYCYKNVELNHNRNRFIYWRSYQDVLELSEISLDFNLYQNNLRYKFTDTPVLAVTIAEQENAVTVLVTTVCSLHRINFPHPDALADSSSVGSVGGSASCSTSGGGSSAGGVSTDYNESSQSFSIFREASAAVARDPTSFYVIESHGGATNNSVPYAANSFLSPNGEEAYYAVACQSQLMLYAMSSVTGHTTAHQLKEYHIMPRLFTNLKEAFIGKSDHSDAEFATSLVFNCINEEIFLLALYRNDQLRVWSTTTFQTVCAINCIREGNERRMQGPQCNSLRKIGENSVCVFLSHSAGAEFICIDIVATDSAVSGSSSGTNAFSLVRRKEISAPQLDLADYDVSPTRIWALWSNAEGEFSISNFSLLRGTEMHWITAAMEPPPERYCIGIEHGMDPKEAYSSYIFHPGKFEAAVISKALFMFRRTQMHFDAKHCSMALLKEHVCQAIEDELQNELKDYDFCDEEYLEISMRLWERFYSCCEQYHLKASQPTGLCILTPLDAVCVVKKSTFSLLRPCETLEHLMLAGDDVNSAWVVPTHFVGNERVGKDLINLVALLAQLEKWLPDDAKIDLDRKLFQLEMPGTLIARLTDDILGGDANRCILPANFLVTIRQKLQAISDLRAPMALLLDTLRLDNGSPQTMQTHLNVTYSSRLLMSMGTLFGSQVGLSVLAETVRQTATIRFAICRNLLILQQILMDTYLLPVGVLEVMRTEFTPDTIVFLQSYYVMVWIAETPLNLSSVGVLEPSIQRLHQLQLVSGSGRIYSNGSKSNLALLLNVFLNAKGLYTALALYAQNVKVLEQPSWQHTLTPLATIVSQLIWPVSMNFVFCEWLFSSCQHIIIEGYVRLLNKWCEWNMCTRQFMLAVTHLDCGEAYKAYDLFLQSAKGVLKEPFLFAKILKNTPLGERLDEEDDDTSMVLNNQAVAQYYLKVIQLFEQHDQRDSIIAIAQVAIGLLERNDTELPMFQSIVFNNHLQLEHYEQAYHSLIYNADSSRRKDCLRQLVVTLFGRKRLDLLMHFPYVGLHEEFESIVESRARSTVIEQNDIYDFLYAFHVNNGNMRKASAVMYEKAMRLQLESDVVESLRKRCSALLVCINALHLIDKRYRWIAKPVFADDIAGPAAAIGAANRDQMDTGDQGEVVAYSGAGRQQVVVLEIKNIRCELLQSEALMRLAQHRKDDVQAYIHAGPPELAMILANCGLYTPAIKLAKGFAVPLSPIFEVLTAACVRTADENINEAWAWLQENDLADLPHRTAAADMAWSLLQKLLREHEAADSTSLRKAIANKLLCLNAFVPQWLYNDYKRANCAELLRLYVRHNRLLEAAALAQELICAMLGAGSEYYSCQHAVAVTNTEMCLPLNTLDLLMHGLRLNGDQDEDIEYKQAAVELGELVQRYVESALRTADDKIRMAHEVNEEDVSFA